MINNNAGSRCDVDFWTKHLQNTEENERAELKQIRGLKATNLHDALLEMQEEAAILPRLKNFMYHADFNPREHERLTEEQWERAFEIFEKHRGIPQGTPRIVYEHEKHGRVHRHVIWTRLDTENMRAFPDGLDWKVAHTAAREIEKELGLQKTIGPLDREPGSPRPPRAPEAWEMYRAMKTGIDPRDITAEVTGIFRECQNGKAFQAALESHGYQLVTGRRGLLILDSAGKEHSLAKRIDGIKTAELTTFMRNVDRAALPTVEQAKEQYQERKIAGLEADRATVLDEIQWEETLAKAAIAKEEKERQFVEPQEPAKDETRAQELAEVDRLIANADPEQLKRARLRLENDKVQGQINAMNRETVANLKRDVAEIDQLIAGHFDRPNARPEKPASVWDRERDDSAWQDAVINAAIEREKTAREFVEPRMRQTQGGREKESAQQREPPQKPPAPELGKTQGEIRLARSLSPGPQGFANALEDRGYILARVTADDIKRDVEQLLKEWEERRRNPQTWMEHEGGFATLKPELQDSARRSFDAWNKERDGKDKDKGKEQKNQYTIEDYVDFVQKKWLEGPKSQLERAAGELAVITPFGSIYTLTPRNTGLDRDELPYYLKGIDRAPLLSVTDAQVVIEDVRDQRREEWFYQRREEWSARQPLRKTDGEIRLAYSLTSTGQEFANALEDRGHILARMTEADAERLNRWERQRLKEEWKAPAPSIPGKDRTKERVPQDKFRAGELVAVNPYGQIFQLTLGNTGHDAAARAERLQDIDLAPLLSVTAAENVMKKYQQHRQEERQEAWHEERQQKRDEWQRATNEKYAPIHPPSHQSWPGFEQAATAATRDERTQDLRGPAAQIWAAWCEIDKDAALTPAQEAEALRLGVSIHEARDKVTAAALAGKTISFPTPTKEVFAASLDDRGISFAIVTKEEAERSHREAEFGKATGNRAPRFREGEIVIVTEQRPEYRRDSQIIVSPRVHRLDQSLAEKFVKHLGIRRQLQGIDATLKVSDERAQLRRADRAATRLERATDIKDFSRIVSKSIKAPAAALGKVAVPAIGKIVEALANAADSLLAPTLTPQQIHDGEKAKGRREADAETTIDFSKYTAEAAQQRQQHEQDREAERQRQHDGGGRER